MPTVHELITRATQELHDTSDAPHLDSQWLLLHVLRKTDASWLASHSNDSVSNDIAHQFESFIAERKTGKPLAYILGTAEFYGRPFIVNEHVLIPRPETEALVRRALEVIHTMSTDLGRSLVIADIGTGSGCIAVSLLLESNEIEKIYAVDISSDALDLAQQNATAHKVSGRIEFLAGSMLAPLQSKRIDLIVSNPPYVPSRELILPPTKETRGLQFEPRIALDGGPDGNTYINGIKASGIPALVETQQGNIQMFGLE